MNPEDLKKLEEKFDSSTKTGMVFQVLKDHQWHCRECEYKHTGITQIAGGSGIQGLQRGNRSRLGLVIESGNHFCEKCDRTTRHDRWQGQFQAAVQAASMPSKFVKRAVALLKSRDVIEGTERPTNQLTIDHKLPMIRWDEAMARKQTNYAEMSDQFILRHFQLLKKSNGSVSHNLLKSRACERCFRRRERGTPFGIRFFYSGGPDWEPKDRKDATGCRGCGWYDFDKWRIALNKKLKEIP